MHQALNTCKAFLFAWIVNSISRELLNGMVYSSSAFIVWSEFKFRLIKIDDSRIYQLHREICFTQQNLDRIATYLGKLKLLWNDFKAICNLPNCGCELFNKHTDHFNNLKLLQFITGLNESYSMVSSNLLMRVPLPALNEAYNGD